MTCFRLQNGETLRSYCVRKGHNLSMAWKKADAGMSPDEVVKWLETRPASKRTSGYCKYRLSSGESFISVIRKLGLSYQVCYKLVAEKNMTCDEALLEAYMLKKSNWRMTWQT